MYCVCMMLQKKIMNVLFVIAGRSLSVSSRLRRVVIVKVLTSVVTTLVANSHFVMR